MAEMQSCVVHYSSARLLGHPAVKSHPLTTAWRSTAEAVHHYAKPAAPLQPLFAGSDQPEWMASIANDRKNNSCYCLCAIFGPCLCDERESVFLEVV